MSFRFVYRSLEFATKAAKRLRRAFAGQEGFQPITIGRTQAILAQLAGYNGWEKLKAAVDPDSADKIDQELDEARLVDRRRQGCNIANNAESENCVTVNFGGLE